jgi:hypothetical protein
MTRVALRKQTQRSRSPPPHPEIHQVGITHRYHPFDAESAFRQHARPARGRLKVTLSESIPREA